MEENKPIELVLPLAPKATQIQVMTSDPNRVITFINNPIMFEHNGRLLPGAILSAREAIEVAINLIYIAKLSETIAQNAQAKE